VPFSLSRAGLLAAAVAAASCVHGPATLGPGEAGPAGRGAGAGAASTRPRGPLDVLADTPEIRNHPTLRARLRATPHGYFRYINAAFTLEVCRRFQGVAATQPAVTLHGDCHVEQYAVTELGRGLTDFDDSAGGPAFVDLVRFGVSLRLAARQRGWVREASSIYNTFLHGYERALRDPRVQAPEPAAARRIAASFRSDRVESLARSEALMETLPEREPEVEAARREMVLAQVARDAGLPESYFDIKKIGVLRIGIGSALSAKYLMRVEGPTPAAEDDVMLEAKEVLQREGLPCIQVTTGPSRIFAGEQRLAYQPFRFPGVLHVGGKTFWVHAWTDHYVELDVQKSVRTPDELREVAFDVGVQLGRGHPKRVDEEDGIRLRMEVLRSLPRDLIRKEIVSLTEETIAAWNRFKDAAPKGP
jgi:hypothetical protein